MKIAVSSTGTDLGAQIDPRFGRCAYFLIIETEGMSFEAFDNANIALGGGAGIQSAQLVASKGAKAVITGSCGPNAVRTLSAADIELFVGQMGNIKEAVERYKKGELTPTNKANAPDHYGMRGFNQTGGTSTPDFGMDRGRGMGRGIGMSGWRKTEATPATDSSGKESISLLKNQAADLKRQMDEIESRIRNLEKESFLS